MSGEGAEVELERAWSAWLLERNRRGTRAVLWIGITLYPAFGILDWLIAPRAWLWLLYLTRGIVAAVTLLMFRLLADRRFDRLPNLLSASYLILGSCGISLMTVFLGGLGSPYYAGLSLIIVATGLLFVWPPRVVLATHSMIVASFIVPNVLANDAPSAVVAVSNLFFLLSTAIIISSGQILAYRMQREQVRSQLIIERTKGNLERAHVQLENAHEQLKQLDRFKSQLFANITHELKTPLAMILAPLELLIQGELGASRDVQRSTLQSMFRNGMKLLKLIADLLDLSKLEESRLRLGVGRHDLVDYLRGLLAQVQPLAQRKALELRFASDRDEQHVYCDIDRLERVFVNLLSNAMKFVNAKGSIWLTVRDRGDAVQIEVKDDGPGFPAAMAERVFERFFQVDMAGTRKHGGAGIGLALAKELVLLHGGRIWAESDTGKGATFTVELRKGKSHYAADLLELSPPSPAEQKRAAVQRDRGVFDWTLQLAARDEFRLLEIDAATEQRVVERDPDENERLHTVLVVDDSPEILRIVHLTLRQYFRVFAASDGKKGFELATTRPPSLVITDYMMPEVDGIELTRSLRADPRTRHVPIVMLTARGDVEDRVAGVETGVNVYLTKPFSTKELLTTVRSLLDLHEKQADILLTSRMDSLETIAGGLAHEINNPLNYVKSAVALLKRDLDVAARMAAAGGEPTPEELKKLGEIEQRAQKLFDAAESGVRRISGTVDLMRRYSREGYSRALQPYDVFAAARDVVSVVLPATGRNVRTELSFEGDGAVECVPEELNQVVSNLVQNAIEAAPEGTGVVRVCGLVEGAFVVLSVTDNGSGIAPEQRTTIFTPFFSTKEPGRGMGMGLTISRRVVNSLGGSIHVGGEPGAGAEFVVRLPRAQAGRRGSVGTTVPSAEALHA